MQVADKLKQNKQQLADSYRLEAYRQLYSKSFYDFFRDAFKVLRPSDQFSENWHLEYIADYFQKEVERINRREPKSKDVILNVPPRSSKTLLLNCLNAWTWGCVNPALTFLTISHSEEVATENAKNTKDLMESEWYKSLFPHVVIRPDLTARSNFQNTLTGSRFSYSILSNITGLGCDIMVLDDPHNAAAGNSSLLKLDANIKAFREVLYNRINDPKIGLRAIVGQRIHSRDIFGFLLENSPERYHHICLPVGESDSVKPVELKKHYIDGQLWVDRFPTSSFSSLSDSNFVFNTQYMQNPVEAGSGIVKEHWFDERDRLDHAPNIDYSLVVDPAFTAKHKNDPSGILICGVVKNDLIVKESLQVWLEFPDLIRKLIELSEKHKITRLFVEPKGSGISLIQALRKETTLNIIEIAPPKDSKITRLNAVTPKLEAKRVKLVRGNWNENFIYELTSFPNSKHDDQLDCLVYAINKLLGGSGKLTWYM